MKGILLLPLALGFAGCRDEAITRRTVPKEGAPAASATAASAAERTLRWTLPKGWKQLPASGMRLATIIPAGGGKAEVTVIALPGDVGGELANLNRWRGQLGLPALDEAGLVRSRSSVASRAGSVSVYDLAGGGETKTGLIAGAISAGGRMWFFKLMGDAASVAAARPGFMNLLGSLHVPP